MEEQVKVPVFKASLIYGVILGLASIVLSLLLYFIGQTFELWALILSPIIFVGLLVLLLIMLRKEYGKGFISYGRVVLASFLISLVAALLSTVYTFAIYEFDESYLQDTKYYAIDQIEKRLDKMDERYQKRLSDEQYERVESELKKAKKKSIEKVNKRSTGGYALGGIFNLVFLGVLIGLIAGIFIKKNPVPITQ